jgi:beta-glucosidase
VPSPSRPGSNLECTAPASGPCDKPREHLLTEADLGQGPAAAVDDAAQAGHVLEPDPDVSTTTTSGRGLISAATVISGWPPGLPCRALGGCSRNDGRLLPLRQEPAHALSCPDRGLPTPSTFMGQLLRLLSHRYSSYLQGIVSKVSNATSVNYRPAFHAVTPLTSTP